MPQSQNASNWDDESFYRYTGGRWLYNEDKQMVDRSVRFNMTELVRAAAISQGCDISACIKVEKLSEGDYNKISLISLHGGHQVVARVPNKNAGLPFYTTASEVATMNFVSAAGGNIWWPGGYKPTAKSKLDVLDDFEKVAAYLLPKDASVHIPVLWHGDLHDNNIFVDPDDPSKILTIIDWQTTHIAPLFQQARTLEFLDFIGPHPSLGLIPMPPLPDNFDSLSAAEKEEAEKLLSKQSLFKIYEIQSGRNNMPVFKALQHSQTLGIQIISLISQVFNDREPIINGQLIKLALDWEKVVGPNGPPCPLQFTEADIAAQRVDQQRWEEGVQMKGDVLEALGGAEHGWAGWSSHEDYDVLTKKLAIVKEQFLEYMANNEAEKTAWENVWPYRDD
ncbi:phosphotransferase [Trichophyton violaceum]|uniref:Altered inheritance of mitochondria protein 9, mitochondrial n=1 Tax=Trichophyton violaceum TaxID=34388 RepID=A0A178FUS5_TRIVO|nr:phosphotransferase [Trichophyton violaceum]